MSEVLEAIYDGQRVGRMTYAGDEITFVYADEWRDAPHSFPLSLSMPLAQPEYPDETVRPFISGLLPDDPEVLRRWGQKFQVSPRNPFRLLIHVGEECAGAVQFVSPERASHWLGDSPPEGIDWLSDSKFIQRIEALIRDRSEARRLGDEGHFSLAGAQAKTALYRDPDRGHWGIPKGTTPTTHIIKPNRGDLEGFETNEQFCLSLATRLGLKAAESWTESPGGNPVIIVKRYDRARIDGRVVRVHQEDLCQALAIDPGKKYQSEGGPSAVQIVSAIRGHSSKPQEDVRRFLDAMIFNWLIGGTDAHAKNYSFLLAGGGQVRLAPLYDLISILPYKSRSEMKKVRLAMKIGGQYLLERIGPREWEKAAREWNLSRDLVFERVAKLAEALPEATKTVAGAIPARKDAERHFLRRLTTEISKHAERCLREFPEN